MVIPPPNVTGKLHIGHAYGRTIEDILARWKRMLGLTACSGCPGPTTRASRPRWWSSASSRSRESTGARSGAKSSSSACGPGSARRRTRSSRSCKRLGCSLDWSESVSRWTRTSRAPCGTCSSQLYDEGLIYRGRYVVNWCPRCETAVSDLEVVHREAEGTLYRIRYDVPGVPAGAVVATTRPETMLGDTALAIHPEDPRTAKLRGKTAVLPIVGRELPIIEDAILVDREFGTGIVKVTPAHDANDFETGQRHDLPSVVVIGPDGKMTAEAGEYAGLDRFEARKQIVARLTEENRLVAAEPHKMSARPLPALRHGHRAVSLDAVVRQGRAPRRAGDRGRREGGESVSCRSRGRRPTSSGCETSTTGASPGSSGGATGSRRSPAPNGHVTVAEQDPAACATCGAVAARAGSRRARHLVLLAALAVLRLRLARGRRPISRTSTRPTCS